MTPLKFFILTLLLTSPFLIHAAETCSTENLWNPATGQYVRVSVCQNTEFKEDVNSKESSKETSKETIEEWANRVSNDSSTRIVEKIQPAFIQTEILPGIFLIKTGTTWGGWGTSLRGIFLHDKRVIMEVAHEKNKDSVPALKEIFNGTAPEMTRVKVRLVDATVQWYEVSVQNAGMLQPQIFQVRLR